MKIVIIGLGKVGRSLANNLCNDGHDITVIDTSEDAVKHVTGTESEFTDLRR